MIHNEYKTRKIADKLFVPVITTIRELFYNINMTCFTGFNFDYLFGNYIS